LFALSIRSDSEPVEPVGPGDVDPVGPPDVDPDCPADADVDPDGPELVAGDIGELDPVRKGEVTASQTTVAPSDGGFETKQYSSLSLM